MHASLGLGLQQYKKLKERTHLMLNAAFMPAPAATRFKSMMLQVYPKYKRSDRQNQPFVFSLAKDKKPQFYGQFNVIVYGEGGKEDPKTFTCKLPFSSQLTQNIQAYLTQAQTGQLSYQTVRDILRPYAEEANQTRKDMATIDDQASVGQQYIGLNYLVALCTFLTKTPDKKFVKMSPKNFPDNKCLLKLNA
jgi:hypothetical protein